MDLKPEKFDDIIINYKFHRADGPVQMDGIPIIRPSGLTEWFVNGKHHNENGPAIEHPDGTKEWYFDGKRHRLDGPAIERADGTKEYYLFGEKYDTLEAYEASASILRFIQNK